MRRRSPNFSLRVISTLTLALLIAGCTKGGQFDPTDWFNSDVFDSKKKLKGERQPVFPEGVPGATTGVPQDLVKGYQPPPEQPENNDTVVAGPKPPPSVTEADKPKPKPKPKPKVAAQKPATPAAPPTRISVGPKSGAGQQPDPGQSVWPAPPQQTTQTQTAWPAPPSTAPAQPAQPSQSVWPNPPPPASPR